jgi:hypothetical protein
LAADDTLEPAGAANIEVLSFHWGVTQTFMLPYVEQDNLYTIRIITTNHDPDKMLTDVSDGTSNTMMLATKAGGEVVSNFLIHEPAGPQGIIAILIGLAADPSGAGGREAAGSSNRYMTTNTTLDDQKLVATTYGRGTLASQITHDVEFEKWADASQFKPDPTSSRFYDLLISSYLERTPDSQAGNGNGRAFVDANSILHEDNEFYFPRM